MTALEALITRARAVRRGVETERGTVRSDVARELSIAITHLEDAEMRLVRANVRATRNPADAVSKIDQLDEQLVDTETEED